MRTCSSDKLEGMAAAAENHVLHQAAGQKSVISVYFMLKVLFAAFVRKNAPKNKKRSEK